MSEKRERKGMRGYLPQILKLLHEGLLPAAIERRGDEKKGEGIPHSTLHEILGILEKEKVIYKDHPSGKWYYTWKKEKEDLIREYQNYENMDEYLAKLQHSKELLGPAIDKARGDHNLAVASLIYGEYMEYFLQHLEEGYHDVFELFNQWKRDEAEMKKAEDDFEREIKRIAPEKGLEIKESFRDLTLGGKQASPAIFNVIKRYWKLKVEGKHNEPIQLNLGFEGVSDPLTNEWIAVNRDIKEDLEGLIKDCIHAENMESLYEALKSIEDKENEDYSRLSGEIIKIIGEVKLGSPLKGSCGVCRLFSFRES
jgi:hypothetical protein